MFLIMQVNVHILLLATVAAKPGALNPQPQPKLMLIIVGISCANVNYIFHIFYLAFSLSIFI